jgi:hypothetical protein
MTDGCGSTAPERVSTQVEVRAAGLDAQGLEENWESSEFHPERPLCDQKYRSNW